MKTAIHRTNRPPPKVVVAIAVLMSLAALLAVVPLWEARSEYCLYCGRTAVAFRCLGVRVRVNSEARGTYTDGVAIPPHEHRMMVSNRSRLWAYRGKEHLDEFGWTGRRYRQVLVTGIAAHPERKEEIIADYLKIDPEGTSGRTFMESYPAEK